MTRPATETTTNHFTATYSPDDNKIRISSYRRIDSETFARLKAAGYIWAPKQECMVAPMWTPARYDLAVELAGEVGDDDTTLADRAEERAERFENYSDKRAADGDRSHAQSQATGERFAMGQPILIGHHSERKARKDAQRIENNMRHAVKMWETSEYWKRRAEGALAHAKYKELPAVRARRIKKLEAEKRGQERGKAQAEKALAMWTDPALTLEKARDLAGFQHYGLTVYKNPENGCTYSAWDCLRPDGDRYAGAKAMTLEEVQEIARRVYPRTIERCNRWIEHYNNRLVYEIAMLNEQGKGDLIAKKPRPKQLPLVNYRQPEGFTLPHRYRAGEVETLKQIELTSEQYKRIHEDQKGTRTIDNSHRIRIARVEFNEAGEIKRFASYNVPTVVVFLTDSKAHEKPEAVQPEPPTPPTPPAPRPEYKPAPVSDVQAKIAAVQTTLYLGVQVAVAPQLYPTPPELAARVVDEAGIAAGHSVLEPSAGTGALLEALPEGVKAHAVELNAALAKGLAARFPTVAISQADFLEWNNGQRFERIVMNPPFSGQADIDHVLHALTMLADGGRLVAIMSAGVEFRQDKKAAGFRALVESMGGTIERLPEGSFKEAGTAVNTVLVTIDK